MKMLYIILFMSFYLDGIFSNLISINTKFLNPLFSLVAIINIYPFFTENKTKYYKICLVYGILYDLIYTNTIFLHALLFFLIGYMISYLHKNLTTHLLNIILATLISIIIYRFSSYTLICIVSNYEFSFLYLLKSITTSIFSNIIYTSILYFLLKDKYHYYKI